MEKKEIAKLKLHSVKPTTLNLKLLQNWVVWQFPKKCTQSTKGYCGAVHPPLEQYGWLPAIIHPEKNEAQVHAHLTQTFATPELAAEHLNADGNS